jgi:hypothetical protein
VKSVRTNVFRSTAIYSFLFLLTLSLVFISCEEKEVFEAEEMEAYMPVEPGKYIIYRLDSLVFTNFGRNEEIHRYQVMHQVDAQITDNQGRPAYRVYTFIRDSLGTMPWQASGTYSVTILGDQVEVQEDNLRFIKLHAPLNDGFNWKGNRFMPTDPYDALFPFTNDDNIDDWDYYYDGTPASFSYRGETYDNVVTVEQVDETFNVPITNPGVFALKSRSVERYSKDIGLVFRQYELWDYQPNTGGSGGGYKTGFGITMWMIDHN